VQVDPIKPKLKASGTKRLILNYDEPLSNFAFKFSLRRHNLEYLQLLYDAIDTPAAGAYTRPLFSST